MLDKVLQLLFLSFQVFLKGHYSFREFSIKAQPKKKKKKTVTVRKSKLIITSAHSLPYDGVSIPTRGTIYIL